MFQRILNENICPELKDNYIDAIAEPFETNFHYQIFCHRCCIKTEIREKGYDEKLLIRIRMNPNIDEYWNDIVNKLNEIKELENVESILKIEKI